MKTKAINLFLEETKFKKQQIKKVNTLRGGNSSNQNFIIELKNGIKYQVKFPDERMIGRKSIYAYKHYNSSKVKFVNEDGTLIKEWIEGEHPNFNNSWEITKVIHEISKFHDIKISKEASKKFGLYEYRKTTKIPKELLKDFDNLCEILETFPKGFIHGDINPGNILVNDKRAFLIDLEWAMPGWLILDYAYLLAFSNIELKDVSEFTGYSTIDLKKMVRLVRIHTLMWCENEKTKKANILFEDILKKLS